MPSSTDPSGGISDGSGRDRRVPETLATALARDAEPKQPQRSPTINVAHLLDAGLLTIGMELSGIYKGGCYRATVTADGHLLLDGHVCRSPSAAAKHVTGGRGSDGWRFWYWEDPQSRQRFTLAELRAHLLELLEDVRRRGA